MKLIWIFAAFLLVSCQSIPVLPGLDFPAKFDIPSAKTKEQKWHNALNQVQNSVNENCRSLDQITDILYQLLENNPSFLAPLVKNHSTRRKFIIIALEQNFFQNYRLNNENTNNINTCWQKLEQIEQKLLITQVIVGILRMKWPYWLQFPDIPNHRQYPRLAILIQDLPTMEKLEQTRSQASLLADVCRQLLTFNPGILPPTR